MEITFKRTTTIVAALLLIAAVTQAIYTAYHAAEMTPPRQLLWGVEGFLFTLLAAFAGSALAQAKRLHLAVAAITAAAILNVVQVGVGLTMFGPFFEVAGSLEATAPLAQGVLAFSFMVYNAAKVLLALALIAIGLDRGKALGGLSALVGVVAFFSNALSMGLGRDFSGELPIAGGSGVLATILLAVCLFGLTSDED
ncbi:MAG: thiamine biosynthesis protein ThiC [Pseudomonadota bacterium]